MSAVKAVLSASWCYVGRPLLMTDTFAVEVAEPEFRIIPS